MAFSVLLTNADSEEATRLQQAMAGAGLEVLLCRDAMSTLARTKNTKPNILVLADELPDASGFDLCDSVRRKNGFAAIPTVILVGLTSEAEADDHRSRGVPATAYLTRPADAEVVVAQVKALLGADGPAAPPPLPPPLPRPSTLPSGPPPPPAPEVVAAEPPRPAPPSGGFEGSPELPPLPTGLAPPTLPPLPPPNPLAEGDPFEEPTDARPPRTGSPDEKVTYFRTLVKSKDETLTRARGVFAAKQQEVLTLREHLRLRELQLGDLYVAREKDLLDAMRTRELAFLEHLRGVHEAGDRTRAQLEAELRDERKLLGEKQRKELQERDSQGKELQAALEAAEAEKAASLADNEALARNLAAAEDRLHSSTQRGTQLEGSVEEAVARRDEAERKLQEQHAELEARDSRIADLQATLEKRQAAEQELTEENGQLKARLDEVADRSRSSLGEAHTNLEATEAKLAEETAAHRQVRESLAARTKERDSAQEEVAKLTPALSTARSELEMLQQSRSDLEHRLAEQGQSHERLAAELGATKRELENERRAHNAAAVAEIDAREKLEDAEAQADELQKSLSTTEAARAAIEVERDALRKEGEAQRERLATLQSTVSEMEHEARDLEQSAAEVDEAHQKELAELESRRAELEKVSLAQKLEITSLRKHEEEQGQRLNDLTERLEIEEMQSRALLGVQADLDAARHELEVLRPKSTELEAARKQLAEQTGLADELERARSLSGELERKLGEARALAEAQADELGDFDQKIAKVEAELAEAQAHATQATAEHEAELEGEREARASAERALAVAEKGRSGRVGELERSAQEAEVRVRDLTGRLERAESELRELTGTHEAEARARENAERRASALQVKLTDAAPKLSKLEEAHFAADARAGELETQLRQAQQEAEAEKRRADELANARTSLEQQIAAQRARADAAQRDSRGRATAEERVRELEERITDHEDSARAMADSHERDQFEADWELALAENLRYDVLSAQAETEDELQTARERIRELEDDRSRPDPRSASLEAEVERLRAEVERLKREQRDVRPPRREQPGPPPRLGRAGGPDRERAATLEAPVAMDELASNMNEGSEDHTSIGPAPLPPTRAPAITKRGAEREPEPPRRPPARAAPPVEEPELEEEPRAEHTTIAPAPQAPPERKRDREPTLPRTRPKGRSRR